MSGAALDFPKDSRLLTSAAFQQVFRRSKRRKDAFFMVCARYGKQPKPRLGLAISKRNARLAVQRNRIKRCVREAFRQQQHTLAHADFVVVNQPPAAKASKAQLLDSLAQHFAGLSKKKMRPGLPDSA